MPALAIVKVDFAAPANDRDLVPGVTIDIGRSSGEDVIAHATLWDRDQLIDLGPGKATDINNAGQIALNTSLNRAAIWENGGMADLGTLGGNSSWAQGMNEFGAVVGAAELADSARHATLWMNGEIIDLNNVVVGNMAFSVLETAYGINDLGQIVGSGRTVDGQSHAFLLTPIAAVPEPTTWLMLVSGLLLVGGSVRRRLKP